MEWTGNEAEDRLSKEGSKLDLTAYPVSSANASSIIRSRFNSLWKNRPRHDTEGDITNLTRAQQVVISRLRTGHCRLLAHLDRIKISCTDECPSGTGIRTSEHVLQSYPTFAEQRRQTWPEPVAL